MRISEWIQAGFAIILAVAAWVQPLLSARRLPVRRRWTVTLLAIVACAAVALARVSTFWLPPIRAGFLRDWLTVGLFLVPYWQTGQFFQGPDHEIEKRLLAFDQWLMPRSARTAGTPRTGFGTLLEIGYLFCYPLVPLGLLAMYAAGHRVNVAGFWLVVLIATYLCYAITPFVPALPRRDVAAGTDRKGIPGPAPGSKSGTKPGSTRIFNRWILKHGSIHAISFPSAHVASSFAVSLVLLRYTAALGTLFLVVSVWIALGAVLGRYHYALDVILGAITALAVFLACFPFL